MAFTKIAAAGIGSTETVTLHSLEVLNNATVGGVLTYEDVTNVDSIGIVTARAGVLVGSGITLSKDGDIFATGVTTATKFVGDGSELTGVASTENIRTNTNATFLQNVNVSGTATVGGIILGDGSDGNASLNRLKFGADGDLQIYHNQYHSKIVDGGTGSLIISGSEIKVEVEPSSTERLRIEQAGNVNISKSVNVGAAITVGGLGAGTSLSTIVGQGFIELTRSSGDTYIDFKNAFADDYDARIITASNQLQFHTGGNGQTVTALTTGTGKVGIATDTLPTNSKLEIHSDKLGGTAGNTQELLYLRSPDVSNVTSYRFTNYRHTNGTSHASSEVRLRRRVDATDMGFLGLGDGYVNFGYGTAEKMRMNSSGILTKPYTPSFSAKGSTDAIVAQSPLPFDSTGGINHNNGNHYSTTTYKFTCPVDGYYYVTCHVVPTNFDVGNNVELYVKDNSGNRHFLDRKVKTSNYSSNNFSVGGSRIIYATATSTLWVEFNGIAGSPTLEGSSHFGITLIA